MSKAFCDTRDRADHRMVPDRFDGKKWHLRRADPEGGLVRFMARSGGFVMARKPRMQPFILTEKEWGKLPLFEATHPDADGKGEG